MRAASPTQRREPLEPDDATTPRRARRARAARRGFLSLLAVVVALGATGWLGVSTATVEATTADGTTLRVTYPSRARPGLAAPFAIEVTTPGRFATPIRLETTSTYLETFDENGLDPDPDAGSSDGQWSIWEFDPPDGPRLTVTFDARIEPGARWRRDGTTRLTLGDDIVASVSYSTWVMP